MEPNSPRMNPLIKAEWVAALRSGAYTQTTKMLRDKNGFCCLGVLCDILKDRMGVEWGNFDYVSGTGGRQGFSFNGPYKILSDGVKTIADLRQSNPTIQDHRLSFYNDSGDSFNEIADLIEEHL